MSVQTRRAGAADLDALAPLFDLYRQFYRQASDLAGARSFLGERIAQGESAILLAADGNEVLGFAQLYPSFTSTRMKRIYILNDLFVTPSARKRGVGAALLRSAVEFAKGEGAVRLALMTAIDNRTAQALYEAEGWVRDEDFYSYNFAVA